MHLLKSLSLAEVKRTGLKSKLIPTLSLIYCMLLEIVFIQF